MAEKLEKVEKVETGARSLEVVNPQPAQTPKATITAPVRGKLPALWTSLRDGLADYAVRQDVAVENILADEQELTTILENARKFSAQRLKEHKEKLRELGLA